jgi:hypothetical protein
MGYDRQLDNLTRSKQVRSQHAQWVCWVDTLASEVPSGRDAEEHKQYWRSKNEYDDRLAHGTPRKNAAILLIVAK